MSLSVTAAMVRKSLAEVRRTGKFAGVPATSADLKEAARLRFNEDGPKGLRNLLNDDPRQELTNRYTMQDATSGYDEFDYPLGAAKLPKGTISRSAPAERTMTAAQKKAMIVRKRRAAGPKGGMR